MLGIITGSAFMNKQSFEDEREVKTGYGNVLVGFSGNAYYLQRHAKGVPPHKINHKANIKALEKLGVDKIISINSCGSLNMNNPPGSLIATSDFIYMHCEETFFDNEMKFTVPGIDEELRQKLMQIAADNGIQVIDGGVYWQSKGPRLETKAEVRMISYFADLVGMTMGSEATLANELKIPYANISAVDNYANGIYELSIEEIEKHQKYSSEKILPKFIEAIERELG